MATPVFHVIRNLLVLPGSLCFCGFRWYEGIEFLHQAALAAGGGILVDDALFSGFVERADRLQNSFFGFGRTRFESCTCLIDSGSGSTTDVTVLDAAFLVLLVAFDL